MSLVASYVLCQDGKTYKTLTYWAPDKSWFVCFDDNEPVELVVKKSAGLDPKEILNGRGIPYIKILSKHRSQRLFEDHSGKTHFEDAVSYFMNVKDQPFPTPRAGDKYDKAFNTAPRCEGVFYGMSAQEAKRTWPT